MEKCCGAENPSLHQFQRILAGFQAAGNRPPATGLAIYTTQLRGVHEITKNRFAAADRVRAFVHAGRLSQGQNDEE